MQGVWVSRSALVLVRHGDLHLCTVVSWKTVPDEGKAGFSYTDTLCAKGR